MNISVAMATYNGAQYVNEQLDSFLTQTRMPNQLVVSDDNSEDHTLEIVREFKKKAPFEVKIFENKENIGYIKNFENAISKTSGNIVFLSDQDDVWFSNKIERILKVFNKDPSPLVVINDQEIVDANLKPSGVTKLGQLKRIGHSDLEFRTGCCTAFHKTLKPLIFPIPSKYVSYDVWIHRIAHYLGKRAVLKQVLQYYRRHEDNVTDGIIRQKSKINLMSFYIDAFFKNMDGYDNKLFVLEELKRRVENDYGIDFDRNTSIKKIDEDVSVLRKRSRLKDYGFYKKRYLMIKMLIKGDYSKFSGYKSFVKDFIR